MADYLLILSHVKVNEGGLSSWQGDSAKRFPSPYINNVKGSIGFGFAYHTNKGVLWQTWIAYTKKKKIPLNGKKWLALNNKTWVDILKTMYWDAVKADLIASQGIAEILFEAIWGGTSKPLYIYLQTYLRLKGFDIVVDGAIGKNTIKALNDYTKIKENEILLIKDLTKKRLEILKKLWGWKTASVAWSRRLKEVEIRGIAYVGKAIEVIQENPKSTGIITIVLVGVGAYLLKFGFPKIGT